MNSSVIVPLTQSFLQFLVQVTQPKMPPPEAYVSDYQSRASLEQVLCSESHDPRSAEAAIIQRYGLCAQY